MCHEVKVLIFLCKCDYVCLRGARRDIKFWWCTVNGRLNIVTKYLASAQATHIHTYLSSLTQSGIITDIINIMIVQISGMFV